MRTVGRAKQAGNAEKSAAERQAAAESQAERVFRRSEGSLSL